MSAQGSGRTPTPQWLYQPPLDAALVILAHWLAYMTRFEGGIPPHQWIFFRDLVFVLAAVKIACFTIAGLYKSIWRYTSISDLLQLLKGATAASLLVLVGLQFTHSFHGMSRSVFILDWLYTVILVAAPRLCVRVWHSSPCSLLPSGLARRLAPARTRCVLLGAGQAGEQLLREALSNRDSGLEIAAVFDDTRGTQGRRLHGVRILGPVDDLPGWLRSHGHGVTTALIDIPDAHGEELRRIVTLCEESGLLAKTIPPLSLIAKGAVSLKTLRDVDFRDLLGRNPATLDMKRIGAVLENKRVLVTGAGGSIGSELCRQIAAYAPEKLLLLDMNEAGLYNLQMELEHFQGFSNHVPLLGNLQHRAWLARIMREHKPQVIFHAAAYKHVPMLESQPWEAVFNNILTTAALLDLADGEPGVERLVLVSTDKAVRPGSVMGASKRLCELLLQAHGAESKAMLTAVRFGNVLGSSGSVVPLFRGQIERGGPVTVTHPDVVRFFMTVEEACGLILDTAGLGRDGEIHVLRMGRPVRIADMARDLIRLSGLEPDKDVAIKYIGLRPGEKMQEELLGPGEQAAGTVHSQIFVLRGNATATKSLAELRPVLGELEEAARSRDAEGIRSLLSKVLPEYAP